MGRRPKHHQHRSTTAGSSSRDTTRKPGVIRIQLLGGFRVWVGPEVIGEDMWHLRKARSLIKLLALSPGHHLHREQIMDALWPDLGTNAASNNLRRVLHSTRKTLDPALGSRYLASEGEWLTLYPTGTLWVDVEAFEEAAATARREREPAAYRAAIELYAGELLPADRYEEWAEDRRQQLRRLDLALLVELADIYEERGEYGAAIEALTTVTAEEPAHEEAHAGLMRLYALVGNNGEALAQYGRLEEALSRELGSEPAASSRALREEIAAGRFPPTEGQALTSPPEVPPDAGKHNLPASRSSFVGRETELRNVKRDLAMTRLLTLTGAGGCGKTRLALEVARELIGAYPDGVWLVELAPLSEGALVAHAVAAALGVKDQPDRSLSDALVAFLRAKRALLVLDNCEHLIDAVARFVDTLLNSSLHLRVLATSRESLNVEGELNWLVPSLSVPSLGQSPRMGELESYESVRLFVERARHRNPSFSLTPENAHAVARICERLEGIPLAIELAAARVGLSVEQIARRLDDSLRLLSAGSRTASPRQRTLRGTLDWSYALLSEPERRLLCRLSVFAGGCTLEAAEAVGAEGDTEQGDILDLLSRLVEKSLVVAEATGGGGLRYRMLEPIRQYAREKLEEEGEGEEVKSRHASFFLALAEEAEPRLRGPEDVEWLERLEADHDNLRAALSWTLEREKVFLAVRLCGALRWFWLTQGYLGEGREWLEAALDKDDQTTSLAARAKALEALFWLAYDQWDLDRAEAVAQEGFELSNEAEAEAILAASFRTMLAAPAWVRGNYERASELLEESIALSRELDDKIKLADALFELALASNYQGDYVGAKEIYEEGIVVCQEAGYTYLLPAFLLSLGYLLMLEGDYERGVALNEEAAALFREHGYKGRLQFALNNLGWAALLQGDHKRARRYYDESLVACKELGDKMIASDSLEGLACISGAEGRAERAATLFGAVEALRDTIGAVAYQHSPEVEAWLEPYLEAARSSLKEASWEAAWTEGQGMTLEKAIEYALSEGEPTSPISPASKRLSADEPPALTRREREVAALVAHGLTNAQIAKDLIISEHTVHHHITNILKKLNLSSRQQVASRLSDR